MQLLKKLYTKTNFFITCVIWKNIQIYIYINQDTYLSIKSNVMLGTSLPVFCRTNLHKTEGNMYYTILLNLQSNHVLWSTLPSGGKCSQCSVFAENQQQVNILLCDSNLEIFLPHFNHLVALMFYQDYR